MVKLSSIVINTANPAKLLTFWTAFLDTEVLASGSGFHWLSLGEGQPRLAIQEVPDPTEGRRRLHLDFAAGDLVAEVARAVSLGASRVAEHSIEDFSWIVLADPDGNEFCIAPDHG
ncbi:VOC family protein [Arthrobacter sp. GMC3]|uniref:VOC family protein n=1 Tax=Arthrobacter sp. GMC3 TaxID=2058894 RepID=UPI000CE3A649|nr:VOC family protein [Arthrobacter sp. GMC3]